MSVLLILILVLCVINLSILYLILNVLKSVRPEKPKSGPPNRPKEKAPSDEYGLFFDLGEISRITRKRLKMKTGLEMK